MSVMAFSFGSRSIPSVSPSVGQRHGVYPFVVLPNPGKPSAKIPPVRLPALGSLPGFQVLPVGQKVDALLLPLKVVGVEELLGVLGEVRRVGDIQDLPRDGLQLLQQNGGLSAASTTHHKQGGGGSVERRLDIVKGQELIKNMDAPPLRRQVAERQGLLLGVIQIGILAACRTSTLR